MVARDSRRVAEHGQHALPARPHVREQHLGGIAGEAPQHVDVVDERRQEIVREDPPLERREVADGLPDEPVLVRPEALSQRGRDVGEAPDVVVPDLVRLGGMEHRDLDGLEVAQPADERLDVPVGGVVALHVGDHAHGARRPMGGEDLVGLAHGEAHGLLGHHVLPRPQRVDDDLAVGVGAQHHDGVDLLLEKLAMVRVAPGDPVVVPHVLQGARRDITECHHLVELVQLLEVRQVHHLADQPTPHDADANPGHASSS